MIVMLVLAVASVLHNIHQQQARAYFESSELDLNVSGAQEWGVFSAPVGPGIGSSEMARGEAKLC